MEFPFSAQFESSSDMPSDFAAFPPSSAVFALFPRGEKGSASPYLSRTRNLQRRLARLLSPRQTSSRLLNLREVIERIEYRPVGSVLEAQWFLYLLHREYYPKQYRERLRLKPPALLKVNLQNRYPRCYPTRRLLNDGSLYYGPFPSQVSAERFASEFLDFFKIRRCVEDLNPDPSHPGCIYSQLRMCLAPCFQGCTDTEYQEEVTRVIKFLDTEGRALRRDLESERAQASETLEFEQAAKTHRRIEKVNEVLRQKPDLARNLRELHAVIVQRGAEAKTVVFFRVAGGEFRGPVSLSLDENVPSPEPLDKQLQRLLASLSPGSEGADPGLRGARRSENAAPLPPWEHLSLLARWYYSSFREGELVMLNPDQAIPHARLIRLCRKLLAT